MKTKFIIFGITGDLSKRKLLPALGVVSKNLKTDDLSVLGISRRNIDHNDIAPYLGKNCSLSKKLEMKTMDLDDLNSFIDLKKQLDKEQNDQIIIYLAVPPLALTGIINNLGKSKLNSKKIKLLLEKPFGIDLASSIKTNKFIQKYYSDDQVYRIDHYMAKEMVQNFVTIRWKNQFISRLWDNRSIESINIIASEAIDIEGRALFYEQTGSLRDVVQGHLMQLAAMTLMDIDDNFDWKYLPAARLVALKHLNLTKISEQFRSQYNGYKNEVKNLNSTVDTFTSISLKSNLKKWHNVKIRLTTGKALKEKYTKIIVKIRGDDPKNCNYIIFRIQPDEGLDINLFIKKPGYERTLDQTRMTFSYPNNQILPDAYEQIIVDAINGKKSLFTTTKEVERCWKILQPIQKKWAKASSIATYDKGSDTVDVLKKCSRIHI
jgi:glucose-6-phosphate 1-dehydrogenase